MFCAWRGACGVNGSGITRFSFAGAGSLPCGLLTAFQTSFVHPLFFGVLSPLMEVWATLVIMLDSNLEVQ